MASFVSTNWFHTLLISKNGTPANASNFFLLPKHILIYKISGKHSLNHASQLFSIFPKANRQTTRSANKLTNLDEVKFNTQISKPFSHSTKLNTNHVCYDRKFYAKLALRIVGRGSMYLCKCEYFYCWARSHTNKPQYLSKKVIFFFGCNFIFHISFFFSWLTLEGRSGVLKGS